jgi:hypothetical protein
VRGSRERGVPTRGVGGGRGGTGHGTPTRTTQHPAPGHEPTSHQGDLTPTCGSRWVSMRFGGFNTRQQHE